MQVLTETKKGYDDRRDQLHMILGGEKAGRGGGRWGGYLHTVKSDSASFCPWSEAVSC